VETTKKIDKKLGALKIKRIMILLAIGGEVAVLALSLLFFGWKLALILLIFWWSQRVLTSTDVMKVLKQ